LKLIFELIQTLEEATQLAKAVAVSQPTISRMIEVEKGQNDQGKE